MRIKEVPQDDVPDYSGGITKGNYALNDEGKYVMVPSIGFHVDEIANAQAVNELNTRLDEIRKAVLAGFKSTLYYHMEVRQMTPGILAKTVGIAKFRVKRHFRPEIFAKQKPELLARYAWALALTVEELKTCPVSRKEDSNII
jgi:hypothetical protein